MKKKIAIMLGALGFITVFSFYMDGSEALYGNDKNSIVQVIQSVEGYEDKNIELLGVKDFDDVRLAGFLSDERPSYIKFHKNEQGNYVWNHVERRGEDSLSMFLPLVGSSKKIMFITNSKNDVAGMTVDINGKTIEQGFPSHQPSVTWVDLPITNSYVFQNYTYFDQAGNEIKQVK
ncbi:hypothetical protein [Guptibacillus algicola]|uniref:hypothetical protein n=1 Tax=Guptibacillus algicola TaxID=225844 RepID=UPI001CD45317|nr:hypothetical protein [Alkalihalobacillus algicola]MCA0987342.1 hypothetical protein [Alkalihalobacillus algicola]